jgi:hypothetical protein
VELQPLLTIHVDVEPVVDLGAFPLGERPVVTFASAARLAWLNDLLAVATGERRRDTVRIDVHEVV